MEIAHALVITGEPASRPWACLRAGSANLVPVANKPILLHTLEALRAGGVTQATIVLDAQSGPAIRRAVTAAADAGMSVRYAECEPAIALGRAMAVAERFIPDGPMLIRAAGVLLRDGVEAQVSVFANERLDALALRLPADQGGVCGGYVLSRRAVALALASPGDRSDLLARVRDDGGQARVQEVEGWRPSGSPWALLEANRRVLEGLRHDVDETALVASRIQGTVVIHPDARVERSLVRGPAIIGAGARVSDSYVGPYSSIGERVVIEGAEIEHSVVLEGAELRFVGTRLEASVIGRGARVTRDFSLPAALRLALGDAAEVTLG